jgi:glycosyltransferase involved in cell wall biosynthesis
MHKGIAFASQPALKKNRENWISGNTQLNPVVTVGVCVKNSEKTVREAVNSIIIQDFPHELMEAVVVDGNSKDATMRIIKEELQKTAIQTRFFHENKGLGFARQIVVDNAEGKYIVWVDGDVILSRTYVRQQEEFMEENPKSAIAAGKISLDSKENWVSTLESIGYVVESLKNDGHETSKLLGTRGSILRVEAIRQIGGFNLQYTSHEDTDVAYRLINAGWKFFTTDATLYERQKTKWKDIWKRHVWYGYGLHFLQHRNKTFNIFTNKPNDRIILSSQAYRITHRKVVFLLPLNFAFRKTAQIVGYLRAHLDGYGHD